MEQTNQRSESKNRNRPKRPGALAKVNKKIVIYIILILFSLANVYPIVWMFINSFKTNQDYALNPLGLPTEWIITNYIDAWATANINTYMLNSVFVSIAAVIITVMTGALASFFLARFNYKMSNWLLPFFILGLLIPIHATLVPMFILMKNLGLLNSYWALIFPYVAFNMPISIFLLSNFMSTFPKDIEESAIIDGSGVFRVFWSIILPMTKPIIATVVILNFVNNWNEFSFALVLINDDAIRTLPLGLANFSGEYHTNYTGQMAGLTIALAPMLIFYLLLEKHIVKGMTSGAVKG